MQHFRKLATLAAAVALLLLLLYLNGQAVTARELRESSFAVWCGSVTAEDVAGVSVSDPCHQMEYDSYIFSEEEEVQLAALLRQLRAEDLSALREQPEGHAMSLYIRCENGLRCLLTHYAQPVSVLLVSVEGDVATESRTVTLAYPELEAFVAEKCRIVRP